MRKPEDYMKKARKGADEVYNYLREVTGIKAFDEYFKTVRELRDCIVIFYQGDEEKEAALKLLKKKEKEKSSQLPIMDVYLRDDVDSALLILELDLKEFPMILIYEGGKEIYRY